MLRLRRVSHGHLRRGLTRGATVGTIVLVHGNEGSKKKQKNDERSQYVIENKGSGLQTNPNEANFGGQSAAQILLPQKMAG